MVLHRDLLQPQVFLSGDRKPCTGFNGLVVGNNHTLSSAYIAHTCNGATGWTTPILLIHTLAGECADFNKGFVFITQVFNPLPCGQFVFLVLFFDGFLSTAQAHLLPTLLQLADGEFHFVFVFVKVNVHVSG